MAATYTSISQPASATPFDNTSNGYTASTAQEAIEETKAVSQPLDADLTAIAAQTGTGLLTRTAENTWTTRTITASTPIVISNGNGVSNNPAISHATSGVTAGTYGSTTTIPIITVNNTGHITAASSSVPIPRIYNSSGLVTSPKIWVGQTTVGSNGAWSINYSSAGFTQIFCIMVSGSASDTGTDDRNFPTVRTSTITTTGCSGVCSNSVSEGLLLAYVLRNSDSGTPVHITVYGI